MDAAAFQGMPRFPLTPAEEALLPRPHSSASQVASALPSAYSRHRPSFSSSSSSPSHHHHSHHHHPQHRPQYAHRHPPNHPYPSYPSPASPSSPAFPADQHEYPQNPKDSYDPYLHCLSPPLSPVSHSIYPSTGDLPQRSYSRSPRPPRPSSPQLCSSSYESIHLSQGQGPQASWISSTRAESPEPLSDSERSSRSESKKRQSQLPRRSSSKGLLGRFRGSLSSPNIVQHKPSTITGVDPEDGYPSLPQHHHRTSLESCIPPRRISFESHTESAPKLSRKSNSNLHDISDEERQGHSAAPSKRRPSWRPSLSLIRQESSGFNIPTLQDQRRYPQNDRRRLADTHDEQNAGRKGTPGGRSRKRRRRSPRRGQQSDLEAQLQPSTTHVRALPSLVQVLEKKTRYPLSYDDFEAFLRHHRAVEYLNFWTDVTAHEQLCRTFEISERRRRREQQLEERALDRNRRRLASPTSPVASGSRGRQIFRDTEDTHPYLHKNLSRGFSESTKKMDQQQHGLSSSNLYLTSRSSLQLPLHDHLSFPPETPRYGTHDPSSPFPQAPLSVPHRRGSEQRGALGPHRASMEEGRQSMDETVVQDDDATSRQQTPLTSSRSKISRSSTRADCSEQGLNVKRSFSQQQPSLALKASRRRGQNDDEDQTQDQRRQHVQEEMSQLVEAVEVLLHHPDHPSNHDDHPETTGNPPSVDSTPLQPPSPVYRFGDGSHSDIPSVYSTIQNGRTSATAEAAALLVQSYRTIGLEDLEESALRIYRKYLIQLRTASMAREEQAAHSTASASTSASKTGATDPRNVMLPRISGEDAFGRGMEGYAGQVIAEWNSKWSNKRAERRRRSRRQSARQNPLATAKRFSVLSKQPMTEKISSGDAPDRIEDTANCHEKPVEDENTESKEMSPEKDENEDLSPNNQSEQPKRPKATRTGTSTGITAFLSRLLRAETTVLELPTLTINTTTMVGDVGSEEDDYDEDEDYEYDSDESDTFDGEDPESSRPQPAINSPVHVQNDDGRPSNVDNAAKDLVSSGTLVPSRSITDEYAKHRQGLDDKHSARPSHYGMESTGALRDQYHHLSGDRFYPSMDPTETASTPLPSDISNTAGTTTSGARTLLSAVSHPATTTSFYLPLECRQRIHTQINQEGRTDGAHVFGPSKGFVVDVVLQDHYYPLFLQFVEQQNLGLLHQNHVNNRVKQRGAVALGVLLWVVVVAIQVTLVMMDWGGWSRPWVWIVGFVGGWSGSVCLVTGWTGFSPVLGLLGKIAENKHMARYRRIMEPSVRARHRTRALRMLFFSLLYTALFTVLFAALPQRMQ